MTEIRTSLRSPLRSPLFSPLVGRWIKPNPFSLFQYSVNFVAGTTVGGTQPYGNNNNDGRFFRDPSNVTATYCPDATGKLISLGAAGLRRTTKGHFDYTSGTNSILWCRDWTNAVWVASNMTAAKNQVGADGVANTATLLTATAANATISQGFTIASAAKVFSVDMKRVTGTGPVLMSLDGGTTTTDVSSLLSTTAFTQVYVASAAVTNPNCWVSLVNSGDQITADFGQMCVPSISGLNIPTQQRYLTTTATIINSQSRPNAAVTDLGPLAAVGAGYFAFFWQGRSERPTGGFVITGSTGIFCSVNVDGSVRFSANAGTSTSSAGVWLTGLNNVNKVAGYFTNSGAIKLACNGNLGSAGTGATTTPALDHFDLGTNGSGPNSIMGINEIFSMSPNLTFSDADLIAMTT
ncbi:MAG: hypothetical protein EKK41_23160 [Hyphomicrobiales bacterium]|nr:MAG: hypothetical protein EKK41_23160 [Hyphomicrobiales bacterium]